MRVAVADRAQRSKAAPLATPPSTARASAREACDLAFAPLRWGEGPRIGLLGDSGTGKTHAALELVAEYARRSQGIVIVVDGKGLRTRFAGQERIDYDDVTARPPAPEPRAIILRGDVRAGVDVQPEDAARLSWKLASRPRPFTSLVVYDELTDAAEGGRWKEKHSAIGRAFRQGRDVGISCLWGSQSPQDCPREVFEQSSVILCSRLAGRGLRYLHELDYLEGGAADVLPTLPGDDSPPTERGVFLALRRGRPWDRTLYKF